MKDLSEVRIVVAALGKDGKGHFAEAGPPARLAIPGLVESAFVWESPETPRLPGQFGQPPTDISLPLPGGTKFGLSCFAPHSAGRTDPAVRAALGVDMADDGMHGHPTLDYEVVLSGKIDLMLDSGETVTLTPGTMLMMAGVAHAWRNVYDEPCIFATVTVGATGNAC
jgi:hypothetical protein